MEEAPARVIVIDDDAGVREALLRLFRSAGIKAAAHASPEDFLASPLPDGPGCILLDVVMPTMSGLKFHEQLAASGLDYPVIYLSGNATVAIGVEAMKKGALDFLEKPIDAASLIPIVEKALAQHRARRVERNRDDEVRRYYTALSAREEEVLRHVICGRLNKQIAFDLGIALKTVKAHRARVMGKMKARSVAELVRLCDGIGIPAANA